MVTTLLNQVKKGETYSSTHTHSGFMDKHNIGYQQLSEINPRIVMTSITPFGKTGPYREYKSSDLVSMAMGGMFLFL